MTTSGLKNLHVLGVRYGGARPAERDERSVDAYHKANVYDAISIPKTFVEPSFPEDQRTENPTDNLGLMGGSIADAVAEARRNGSGVLMVGGDCSHITGMLGGLQDAHGPTAKVGLVWFDAHGDFNTPKTTLSGMLGGMPVAVAAGLAYPRWREMSHMAAPIPTDRIVMVDVRNLDAPEEQLVRATEITVAAPAEGFPGENLQEAVADLAARCDYIYLHIDSDILDQRFVPNHGTKEPNGPNIEQVQAAIDTVMATGKVIAFAVVSVYGEGEGHEITQQSAFEMVSSGLKSWERHGTPNGA
ncbi:MAG: arginase family protein [Chloroflexota bacterium]